MRLRIKQTLVIWYHQEYIKTLCILGIM
jgi:hypothetical protein